jgi:hypothetical protein
MNPHCVLDKMLFSTGWPWHQKTNGSINHNLVVAQNNVELEDGWRLQWWRILHTILVTIATTSTIIFKFLTLANCPCTTFCRLATTILDPPLPPTAPSLLGQFLQQVLHFTGKNSRPFLKRIMGSFGEKANHTF